jgi:hypothetical protein
MGDIEKILQNWDNISEIRLNSDAKKLKADYFNRLRGKNNKGAAAPRTGDLTTEDLSKLQEKIRLEQINKKSNVMVHLHDDYGEKMKHELLSKRGIQKAQPKQKQDRKRKVELETKKSVSFEEETKKPSTDFWDDFSGSKVEKVLLKKKVQSTNNNDSFDWDFDQSKQSNFGNIINIESKNSKDQFKLEANSNTKESENSWFDDFGAPKTESKPSDHLFDFDESKKKKERSKKIRTSYFEDFGFEDNRQVNKKQTVNPKNAEFLFGDSPSIQKSDSDDGEDLVEIVDSNKVRQRQEDLLFESSSKHEDLISLSKQSENDDFGFGFASIPKSSVRQEPDEDLLFGFNSKSNEEAESLFGETSEGYDMIELNKHDDSEFLFDTGDNTKSDKGDIMSKLSGLYSDSGLTPLKDNGMLKPDKPNVIKQHEDQKQKFVPELGENFWENLYGSDSYNNVTSAYTPSNPQPSYQVPFMKAYSVPKAQPQGPQRSNVFNLSKPVITQKMPKESNFKGLGIDYLMQTNIKRE